MQGITTQPTDSVDVIILEMLSSPERTLVFHFPTADKIRRIIREIGKRHGLKGERQQFINDDSAPFLLELSEYDLPPMRLLKVYRKLHLRNDQTKPLTGVFATRSPDRPNPLGLHRVTVREISSTSVKVGPIEAIDGTPVVDIKPVLSTLADF